MSDQPPPPPKPKPGSLRDRIAAFEKKPDTSTQPPPLAPRPKPGGISWKPKPPSPPPSSTGAPLESTASAEKKPAGGMSASDAKESIGKGGSLKERMAALQGRGGFGGPPPSVAPKPVVEKPKWKPPPVVAAPPSDEESETQDGAKPSPPPVGTQPATEGGQETASGETSQVQEEGTPEVNDPEEEERQRRAAIAARMARLGGARFGMGPPVIAKKPVVKKVEEAPAVVEVPKSESGVVESTGQPTESPHEEKLESVTSPASTAESTGYFPTRKDSESASVVSVESASSNTPARTPGSMPVPAAPRRTAPPRKKPAKSPSPAPAPSILGEIYDSPEAVSSLNRYNVEDAQSALEESRQKAGGDRQREIGEVDKDVVIPSLEKEKALEKTTESIEEEEEEKEEEEEEEEPSERVEEPSKVVGEPTHVAAEDPVAEAEDSAQPHASLEPDVKDESHAATEAVRKAEPQTSNKEVATPTHELEAADYPAERSASPVPEEAHAEAPTANVDEDEEEEEAARRKRVAERLAKMGGVNPFAPPPMPPRLQSQDSVISQAESKVAEGTGVEDDSAKEDIKLTQDAPEISSHVFVPPPPSAPSAQAEEPVHESEEVVDEEDHQHEEEESHDENEYHDEEMPVARAEAELEAEAEAEESFDHEEDEDEISYFNETQQELQAREREEAASANPEPALQFATEGVHARVPPTQPVRKLSQQQSPTVPDHANIARRTSVPPPRVVPYLHSEDVGASAHGNVAHTSSPPLPPSRVIPHSPEEDIGEEEKTPPLAIPPPKRKSLPPPSRAIPSVEEGVAPEPGMRSKAPSSSMIPQTEEPEQVEYGEAEEDEDGSALAESQDVLPVPYVQSREFITSSQEESSVRSKVPTHKRTPSLPVHNQEVIDESEGDPIDPGFHSPGSLNAGFQIDTKKVPSPLAPPMAPPAVVAQEVQEEPEQDPEQERRRTIAERMAKLGGIRFGAPLPVSRPPPPPPQADDLRSGEPEPEAQEEQPELTEEEEEQARKQRISAKLAGMGGMRFGMLPPGVPGGPPAPPRPARKPTAESSETIMTPPPPPPQRMAPPPRPPPPPQETDSEQESVPTSEDGVKIEAEESEIEEVNLEDAQEELPPPIPTRGGRHTSNSLPPVPPDLPSPGLPHASALGYGRPPVPTAHFSTSSRRSSAQSTSAPSRKASVVEPSTSQIRSARADITPQSEYVMVDDPETYEPGEAPPPLPKSIRHPPPRSVPMPPPPPSADSIDSMTSPWELPTIPSASLDIDRSGDLSMSTWSEDSTSYPPVPPPKQASRPTSQLPPRAPLSEAPVESNLSADDLMSVWGRVGVQICEVATTLFEKSKKSLVGDGSYAGFVNTVLGQVPNATQPTSPSSYGYLIYVQVGTAVQKRVSDIMPGDVLALYDAKLKGHKGLQSYHQNVGVGEPLFGIVSEYEPKKAKVRVFQANQHVGQQSIESASYRLEDLKSGTVKVFRVLDL